MAKNFKFFMPFICPLSNFSVHPAAKVFHYGIEVSLIRIAKKEYYGEEFKIFDTK